MQCLPYRLTLALETERVGRGGEVPVPRSGIHGGRVENLANCHCKKDTGTKSGYCSTMRGGGYSLPECSGTNSMYTW